MAIAMAIQITMARFFIHDVFLVVLRERVGVVFRLPNGGSWIGSLKIGFRVFRLPI